MISAYQLMPYHCWVVLKIDPRVSRADLALMAGFAVFCQMRLMFGPDHD
jgi:hypothetical protein